MAAMTDREKVRALVTEGGYSSDEAVEMLEDMGELEYDGTVNV
jgi:hypothetical protein